MKGLGIRYPSFISSSPGHSGLLKVWSVQCWPWLFPTCYNKQKVREERCPTSFALVVVCKDLTNDDETCGVAWRRRIRHAGVILPSRIFENLFTVAWGESQSSPVSQQEERAKKSMRHSQLQCHAAESVGGYLGDLEQGR